MRAVAFAAAIFSIPHLRAQEAPEPQPHHRPELSGPQSADFGMTYTQERAKFVDFGSHTDDHFYLRGASVDYAATLWKGIGLGGRATGLAVTNLNGYLDIQHIQFLIGPRYTYNLGHISSTEWARRGGIFAEGQVGYTIAPSGYYPTNGVVQPNASALTYAGNAGINLNIYHRFELRLIEGGIVQTHLPNGGTNVQNTLRLASGINVHLGH